MVVKHEQCTAAGCSAPAIPVAKFSGYVPEPGDLCEKHQEHWNVANTSDYVRVWIAGSMCADADCDRPVRVEFEVRTGLRRLNFCETHLPSSDRRSIRKIRFELSDRSLCPEPDCDEPRLVIVYAPGLERLQPFCFTDLVMTMLWPAEEWVSEIDRGRCCQCGRFLRYPYVCRACLLPPPTARDSCKYPGCVRRSNGYAYCHNHRQKRTANQRRRRKMQKNGSQGENR